MVVRVLVVDRQAAFRRGLEESLSTVCEGGVRVVAGTDHVEHAVTLVRRHHPDVVLLDLDLPAPGALAALSAMRRVQPQLPVLGLARTGGASAAAAIEAGVNGVLLRTASSVSMAPTVAAASGAVAPSGGSGGPSLTAAERQLWLLIAGGARTAQIAGELHVSDRTVKRLTARLLRTLGVASRTEAAALAGRAGLLDDIVTTAVPSPRLAPAPTPRSPDPTHGPTR